MESSISIQHHYRLNFDQFHGASDQLSIFTVLTKWWWWCDNSTVVLEKWFSMTCHTNKEIITLILLDAALGLSFYISLSLSDLAWKPFFVPTIFDRLRSAVDALCSLAPRRSRACKKSRGNFNFVVENWREIWISLHSLCSLIIMLRLPPCCSPIVSWVAPGLIWLTVWNHLLSLSDCAQAQVRRWAAYHWIICIFMFVPWYHGVSRVPG